MNRLDSKTRARVISCRKYELYARAVHFSRLRLPTRDYFGQPWGGFFFCRDFLTASCHLPLSFSTSGFGPGLDLGLSGFWLAFLFTPALPSCSVRNCTQHERPVSFLVPIVCCKNLSNPCFRRVSHLPLRLLSIDGQHAFLYRCPLKRFRSRGRDYFA